MRLTLIALLVVTCLTLGAAGTAEARPAQMQPAQTQSRIQFKLGFKLLADQIPEVVGQPVEDEHWGVNGDSLQRTTTGLMVWRKADNWTAFTNGYMTWINGPNGVQSRLNGERFEWEKNTPAPTPAPATSLAPPEPVPAPPAQAQAPARYSPDVRAMDEESAGPGVAVKQWMHEVDIEWERVWGWKPGKPTTVYLYFDGYRMADDLSAISGYPLDRGEREEVARWVHGVATRDQRTGGWAVLLNVSHHYGRDAWDAHTRSVLIHEYAHVMQMDVAGEAGPTWFKEGMAQLAAYVSVPQALAGTERLAVTSDLSCQGQLPSLRSLNESWHVVFGMNPQLAYGMSYFAVKHLADRVGGRPLLDVLERTARGEEFERALEGVTGFSLERLDAEYRRAPCEAYR